MPTTAEIRDAFENVVFDDEGGFDKRKDRERYIRFLESMNKHLGDEIDRLQARLDVIAEDEEMKWLIEHR